MAGLRRSFRFSIRTLLVLVTLFGVYLGIRMNAVRQAEVAVALVKEHGGRVTFGYPQDHRGGSTYWQPARPPWRRALMGNGEYDRVATVYLSDQSYPCNDATLARLIPHLRRLPGLWEMDLSCSSITNEGAEHISQLQGLKWLNLDSTDLDDGCIRLLGRLQGLEKLSVRKTEVSKQGIEELQQLLPACEIRR